MAGTARIVSVLCVAAALVACERAKSENPLSPTIAGPLPNVSMTPPQPVDPPNGKTVVDTEQPLVLVMVNPTSSSPRPFASEIQIATDSQFSNVVVTRTGIQPGDDGKTRMPVGDRLQPGRTYYWRGLAADGANVSGWSSVAAFNVVLPVVFGAPEPMSPIANERTATAAPEFRVRNASASGPFGALSYEFQVGLDPNFASIFSIGEVPQGGGDTKWTVPHLPTFDRQYFWRARVFDSKNVGPWSRVETFRSPVSPPPAPGPGPGPSPGPSQPPGNCASKDGNFIIQCIAAKYPERLAAGVSLGQRQANMEFLRDRMIEAGKCGGLNLGWNLKRGGPERSIDFLARNDGGGNVMGIDIGFDYDNTSQPLRLQWAEAGYGATFEVYPSVPCG